MTNFFFFGATGDHAKLKIIPALFQLFSENILNEVKFFAIGRSSKTKEELDKTLTNSILNYFKNENMVESVQLNKFLNCFEYLQLDSDNIFDYEKLENLINLNNQNYFYLSIPPQNYLSVLAKFAKFENKLIGSSVILEKPFGLDHASSKVLNTKLEELFGDNIFRIDHYLGKSNVNKILCSNEIKDKLLTKLNLTKLRRIEITALETVGVENRGEFYDKVGALVDVGQNHLLEIAGIVETLNVKGFKLENYAKYRAQNISNFQYLSSRRAQYLGYKHIEKVNLNSETETYFELSLKSNLKEFENIEFILKSGKKLAKNEQKVKFYFENNDYFEYNYANDRGSLNEYYFLLQKVFEYNYLNCNFFVSKEELEAQWKLIDEVKKDWKENVELSIYNGNNSSS